jgi:hypothetical protein
MSTPSRVESIFFAALGKKTTAERADHLDHACDGECGMDPGPERDPTTFGLDPTPLSRIDTTSLALDGVVLIDGQVDTMDPLMKVPERPLPDDLR